MIIKETKKYRYVIDKEEYECNYGTKKKPIYFDYHVRKQCKNDHSKDIRLQLCSLFINRLKKL